MNNYEAELIRDQWQRGSGASNRKKVSMNLVDILARELKAWPKISDYIVQDKDGECWPSTGNTENAHLSGARLLRDVVFM